MKKVESLNEYKELLRQNKANRNRVDTNCYLMPNVVDEYIVKEKLFVAEHDQGLVFFVDEGNYFNLHYFWESGKPFPNLKQDKPVLIEELNNNGSRDAYLSQFVPILTQAGFSLFEHNLQVVAVLKGREQELRDKYQERKNHIESQGFRIELCEDDICMNKVVSLWESALHATDIPESHKKLNHNSQVICIFDSDNTLCAAKWWHNKGKVSEGRHVVTHKNFERKGLGSTIQLAWLVDGLAHGVERYVTWIAETNDASHAMHKKVGFLCSGKSSKQFILK